ncbi:MAG TPA: hypothetical protein VM598_05520 [Bdellovibrionota bacterium]|nr:hypothetical protein [Bdellovibrionota bacterium]
MRFVITGLLGAALLSQPASAADDPMPPPPSVTAPDSVIPSAEIPEQDLEPVKKKPFSKSPSKPSMGTEAPVIPTPPTAPPVAPPKAPEVAKPSAPPAEVGSPAPEAPPAPTETAETPPPPPTEAPVAETSDDETEIPSDPNTLPVPTEKAETEPKPEEEPPPPVADVKTDETPDFVVEQEPSPTETRPEMTAKVPSRLHRPPPYQRALPEWAFQASFSPGALGDGDIADASGSTAPTGVSLQVELQPAFLQGFGVLGFGPSLSVYPISGNESVASNSFALWSVGGQVRYQARYFREQPIVPMAGFAFERVAYRLNNLGPAGATRSVNSSVNMTGPFFGAWFLLSVLEPDQASMAYINSGLVRSYLTAEVRSMTGSDDDVDLSGNSYFFGLRVEF